MQTSPVLDPQGRPVFSAGGLHSWKTFEHRGYVVSLEWAGQGRGAQACMCIWRAGNVFVAGDGGDRGIWAIGRRAITQFVGFTKDDKATGAPSVHCFREARLALPILGHDFNDQQAWKALVDTVIRFAPELVLMPAVPAQVRRELSGEAFWDIVATNKNTGKVLSEASV